MTERLYYDNTYLTEFDAVVVECCEKENDFTSGWIGLLSILLPVVSHMTQA